MVRLPSLLVAAVVALIAIVAAGLGGYASWAALLLQVGAAALMLVTLVHTIESTSVNRRRANRELSRNRRRRLSDPFPGLAALLHALNPRRFTKPPEDVEILAPDGSPTAATRSRAFVYGYPYRRHGLGFLLAAMTGWIVLSITPVPNWVLSKISPHSAGIWSDLAVFGDGGPSWHTLSLAPYSSLQDLWLWLAYLMVFFVGYQLIESRRHLASLTLGLVCLGAVSGAYGIYQWASELAQFVTSDSAGSLRATGTFGNRNHYAMFQSMCFLVSIGWLSASWVELQNASGQHRRSASGRLLMMSLVSATVFLGIFFSLSRAAMGATMLSVGVFMLLVRTAFSRKKLEGRPTWSIPMWLPIAFTVGALALWLGVDPIVERYQLIPQELTGARGRLMVWRDSLALAADYWLTGSGLSSFQYVFPIYRTFGGIRFYSWAHNDYLQLLIEIGLPGMLLAAWVSLAVLWRANRIRSQLAGNDKMAVLHAGYCSAAVSTLFHSAVDFGLHLPANALVFCLVIAAVIGVTPHRPRTRLKASGRTETVDLEVVQKPIRLSR